MSQHFKELECSLPCSQEPASGPYPEPDESNPYHPILRLGLPSDFYRSGFPAKSSLNFTYPPCVLHACPSRSLSRDHSNYVRRRLQVMKLLVMTFSPTSYHFFRLLSKYSPQHSVLKYPLFIFHLMSETNFHNQTKL